MDLRSYLDQGEHWIAAGRTHGSVGEPGNMLKIEDMDLEHRRKAARWLLAKSQALIGIVEAQTNEGILAENGWDVLGDVLSLVAQDPKYWIKGTPLFQALVQGLPTRPVVDI